MITDDEDLTIDEDNSTEEEIIEKSDDSNETEPEDKPATIQDEEEGDDDEEEDRVVTIGDSPAEDVEGSEEGEDDLEETPKWVKTVRKSNRKLTSENKKLKRQIEANKKAAEIEKPVELGVKPTLASCKYDDVEYDKQHEDWLDRKRKVEEQTAKNATLVEEQNKSWQVHQKKYVDLKQEHSFKDFDEAEELVKNTFSESQKGIIVQGADDSALLVYALGKNPKKLEELSKITNDVDFAFKVAKLESQLKVKSKKAPKPETRIKSGKAGGTSGSSDKVLERLRKEAEKTGNMTKVVEYKRKLRKG